MFEDSAWAMSDTRTWSVVLTGLVVVFAMLVVLIISIKLISLICKAISAMGSTPEQKAAKKAAKEAKKAAAQQAKEAAKAAAAAPITPQVTVTPVGPDDHVVAAISGAIAMMLGHSNFQVKSIRKTSARSNAWRQAGVLDNTRPF